MKKLLKNLIKSPQILALYYKWKYRKYAKLNREQSFNKIYRDRLWGGAKTGEFSSGKGSHNKDVIRKYILSVGEFLKSGKYNVVDLGCGDFNVGKELVPLANSYIAADIVKDLIEYNRLQFQNLDVVFCFCDIVEDELPTGDVVLIREVLQHLDNSDILKVLPKLLNGFSNIIVTEKIPTGDFMPNKDKLTGSGPSSRFVLDSGVVLDKPPFSLEYKSKTELCSIRIDNYLLKTILFVT